MHAISNQKKRPYESSKNHKDIKQLPWETLRTSLQYKPTLYSGLSSRHLYKKNQLLGTRLSNPGSNISAKTRHKLRSKHSNPNAFQRESPVVVPLLETRDLPNAKTYQRTNAKRAKANTWARSQYEKSYHKANRSPLFIDAGWGILTL